MYYHINLFRIEFLVEKAEVTQVTQFTYHYFFDITSLYPTLNNPEST